MRRRRLPRRPIRRGFIRGLPSQRPVSPKLVEANHLFENGEYENAAILFTDLAEKAEAREIPQAPNLYLRSGAAWLKAGDPEKCKEQIRKGLGILVAGQRWRQLRKLTAITTEKLSTDQQDVLAREIRVWVDGQIPDEIKNSEFWTQGERKTQFQKVKLPSNCGNCSAPVNPAEVEWYSAANPVCSYCGCVLNNG